MASASPEWLVEQGIGETRALLVKGDEILAAKLHWPGELSAGTVIKGKLTAKTSGSRRGMAKLEDGTEVAVDHLPRELSEGALFDVTISRASIAERGRLKRAQGRYLPSSNKNRDTQATPFSSCTRVRRFPPGLWEDAWRSASSGTLDFAGGEILCAVTPAMTVIDIDGEGTARDLALASVPAIAKALRWFELGGNIGIDFPTIETKADRRAVDEALENRLAHWLHERTAMNGFGFVQIVARLEGPSLLHRFTTSRVGMCARYALRMAERAEGNGAILELLVHPALKAKFKTEWLDELARRTGKQVRIETNPSLALESPSAQILTA